jgi:hypothetical protein
MLTAYLITLCMPVAVMLAVWATATEDIWPAMDRLRGAAH